MGQVIDRGAIMAAVDQYPSKDQSGNPEFNTDGSPKMRNKWMKIGESTKWQNDDGTTSVNEKVYLTPVNLNAPYYETKTFWDSEKQQQGVQHNQYQAPQQQYVDPQTGQPLTPQQVQQGYQQPPI